MNGISAPHAPKMTSSSPITAPRERGMYQPRGAVLCVFHDISSIGTGWWVPGRRGDLTRRPQDDCTQRRKRMR